MAHVQVRPHRGDAAARLRVPPRAGRHHRSVGDVGRASVATRRHAHSRAARRERVCATHSVHSAHPHTPCTFIHSLGALRTTCAPCVAQVSVSLVNCYIDELSADSDAFTIRAAGCRVQIDIQRMGGETYPAGLQHVLLLEGIATPEGRVDDAAARSLEIASFAWQQRVPRLSALEFIGRGVVPGRTRCMRPHRAPCTRSTAHPMHHVRHRRDPRRRRAPHLCSYALQPRCRRDHRAGLQPHVSRIGARRRLPAGRAAPPTRCACVRAISYPVFRIPYIPQVVLLCCPRPICCLRPPRPQISPLYLS